MPEKSTNLAIAVNDTENQYMWLDFDLNMTIEELMKSFCKKFIGTSNGPVFVCMIYHGRNLVDPTLIFNDFYIEGCTLFVHYYEIRPLILFTEQNNNISFADLLSMFES